MSSNSFPELYVLRHGETEWNAAGRMQGRLNSPLTAKGIDQARTQRRILEAVDLTGFEIVSSPQTRALHTAVEIFAPSAAQIRTDPLLCEVDIGDWQGRLRAELTVEGDAKMTVDGPLAFYEQAKGGEGFGALRRRCDMFLQSLKGPAVLVTHGITSRMLRVVALGLPMDGMVDLPGGQGVVFHISNGAHAVLQ
ncbi:putative phosphoglycerate mutase [Litoreibacter halocynthiae]|uniref:Putative phosphoglycerate mutase n=1 Tax=Litoreibacter halocynthiae TaxID=1242689 RepID=A0A4V3EWN2_9RHOB|nr:histidine phosphatase family protein [Litoreibacter halocynthiae]TDT77615.1 putative phosphoglycerate mutase [Litoreibacter halocynthiae]